MTSNEPHRHPEPSRPPDWPPPQPPPKGADRARHFLDALNCPATRRRIARALAPSPQRGTVPR